MQNNPSNNTPDIITQANVYAQKLSINYKIEEVDFWLPEIIGKNSSINKTRKMLMVLPSPAHMDTYISRLLEFYTSFGTKQDIVTIENCLIKGDITASHPNLIFRKCKFVNRLPNTAIGELISCDFANPEISQLKLLTGIQKTLFRSPVNVVDNGNSVIIKDSIFLHNLHSTQAVIENCEIKTFIAQNIVEIRKCVIEIMNFNHLTDLIVSDSDIEAWSIRQCAFGLRALFSNTTFKSAPEISDTRFTSRNVHFGNTIFKDVYSDKALGAFRQLKYLCEEAGYEGGAILFHAYELETHFNIYLKKDCPFSLWPEKVSSVFHREFTDYGRDIMRPFLWLIVLFTIGFAWNFILAFNLQDIAHQLNEAALFSLKNSLGPLFFALPHEVRDKSFYSDSVLSTLAFLQIIFSSVIWFLIIFMIRRRFKL